MVEPSTVVSDHGSNERSTLRTRNLLSRISPTSAVAIAAIVLSSVSFIYFFSNGMTNVYGDGIAHVNIARKVVDSPDDSLWRRYIQIGSPWLPLQTVAMLPLVANDWMWRTGVAGSVVSMISFVIASVALYLLAAGLYAKEEGIWRRVLPVLTAAIFIANPSVLYMQSTPMSELIFMAALVVAVLALQRWLNLQTTRRLTIAACAMTVATLARYEAWPVAMLSVLIVALAARGDGREKLKTTSVYTAVLAIGPIYWLWHNWAIYSNPFEFISGPHSARGIAFQNRINFAWSEMFVGRPVLDVLIIAVAAAVCAGPIVWLLSGVGFARSLVAERKSLLEHSPLILLVLPFLFHVFSVYRGEIQVFPLSAFGLLNIRYGLPHLLGIALFAPGVVLIANRQRRLLAGIAVGLLVAFQYWHVLSEGARQLEVFQEGYRNGVNARGVREQDRVASFLKSNHPSRFIVMHSGQLGPLVPKAGLEFADILHEGTIRWHQIDDGFPRDVSTVIVRRDDPLDQRINGNANMLRDLQSSFEERFSAGGIKVYERRNSER